MVLLDKDRWRCIECKKIHYLKDLLTGPNPFDPSEQILGCPTCKSVDQFEQVCDQAGCIRTATCGFPVDNLIVRYRRTCGQHYVIHKAEN